VPVHRDRSRVYEARISGLAITLSVAALALVVVYVVGGFANRVVIQVVAIPGSSMSASP
jgi:signal peptidase I